MSRLTDAAIINQQREINQGLIDVGHAAVDVIARLGTAITALPGGKVYQQIMDSAFEDIVTSLRTLIEQQKIVESQQLDNVRRSLQ